MQAQQAVQLDVTVELNDQAARPGRHGLAALIAGGHDRKTIGVAA